MFYFFSVDFVTLSTLRKPDTLKFKITQDLHNSQLIATFSKFKCGIFAHPQKAETEWPILEAV